jgi:hypothetical protein
MNKDGPVMKIICGIIAILVFIVFFVFSIGVMYEWEKIDREREKKKIVEFYHSRWCVVR